MVHCVAHHAGAQHSHGTCHHHWLPVQSPVADFFAECGGQRQLKNLSYDTALHPNDEGFQIMANVLIQAFEKILAE